MSDVFVSYARRDESTAERVAELLREQGYSVWHDKELPAHRAYSEVIEERLSSCRAVVVLWSAEAARSEWVRAEADSGRQARKLVRISIDGTIPPIPFNQIQCADLSGWSGECQASGWRKVEESIAALLGDDERSSTDAVQAHRHSPRTPKHPVRWAATGAAALIAAIAGAVTWFAFLHEPAPGDHKALQVRLAGFQALSRDVPNGLKEALGSETLAAFADDGAIGISTADKPPTGSEPAYALGGTVRGNGSQLHVITTVNNEHTGTSLWSHRFDFPTSESSTLARDVAVRVGSLVRCAMGSLAHYPKPMPDQTVSLLFQACASTPIIEHQPGRSLDFARRITVAAPDYSYGWSFLAATAATAAQFGPPAEAPALKAEAEKSTIEALRLDENNSEAWGIKAQLLPASDLTGRERLLRRALDARPLDCGCEHHSYGMFLRETGRLEEAEARFRRAVEIMHLNPMIRIDLALILQARGKREEAEATFNGARNLVSNLSALDAYKVFTAPWTGDYRQALETVRAPNAQAPPIRMIWVPALVALASGDRMAQAAARPGLLAATRNTKTNGRITIELLAALGDTRGALVAVERLAATDAEAAHTLLFEPPFETVRGDAAFLTTATRLGLVRYWRTSGHRPDFCRESPAAAVCRALR